ncbi:MAG TPA: hypothetical protein DEQ09_00955 [Bacteroidales bacterium]|nr:hypothetical protein [Bacteroidales bacterium]
MRNYIKAILIILIISGTAYLPAQDTERPLPPVLDLVSVDPFTGHTTLQWTVSDSPDVAGYVIYLYLNEEGYAIDTVYEPFATSYINTGSNASYYPESYVIAAIDSSDNVSPLSNFLNTIYLDVQIDTCANKIELTWNPYLSSDPVVDKYEIYYSRNGSPYIIDGSNPGSDTTYSFESFESYSEYCFYVVAGLSNGLSSFSNNKCTDTDLPIPPQWINADFASYNKDGDVDLSFTIDPGTEYTGYRIERSNGTLSGFETIHKTYNTTGKIEYTDDNPGKGINYYRLAALNSCDEPVIYSNYASTINISISVDNNLIHLSWNDYYSWRGGVVSYTVFRHNRGIFEEIATVNGMDTTFTDNFNNFLYETDQKDVCYKVIAQEGFNSYFENAVSISGTACIEQALNIFVPNAFTPDDNTVNEIFKPVLSFSPVYYRLIIKNRAGVTLFKTSNYLEGWNGRHGSRKLPEDVYIWFLELKTPEGITITKTGTVTIFFNQDSPF